MVNTSKILTVSYGTFSCTLEGFDDSFETMKAIAEYFRDLAGDDRYFGAEPPTPDAEMLARIAEREIARRVEAREDQGKIVLRAGEPPALAATADVATDTQDNQAVTTSEPAPEAAPTIAESPQPEPVAPIEEPQPPEAVEPAEVETEESATNIAASGVSEDPQIEDQTAAEDAPEEDLNTAATSDAPAEPGPLAYVPFPEMPVDVDPVAENFVAEETPEPLYVDPLAQTAHGEQNPEGDIEEHVETAEEFFENSAEPEPLALHQQESTANPFGQMDADSVADKLSRIRSVVSQSEQPYAQGDYSEDEHAQDFLKEATAELDAALAMDDAAEMRSVEAVKSAEPDVDLIASLTSVHSTQIDDQEDDAEAIVEQPQTDGGFDDTLSQLLADSMSKDESHESEIFEIDDETQEDTGISIEEPDAGETNEAVDADADDEITDPADFEESDDIKSEDEAPVAQSEESSDLDQIFAYDTADDKVSREDFEAALAGSMEGDAPADTAVEIVQDEDENLVSDQVLSPEQEEDLQRELAEVEADSAFEEAQESDDTPEADEIVETQDADEHEAENLDEELPAREGRQKLERAENQSEVERIFDEADSHLEKPDSNQRRSAIQHLRAAVAATRAEKKAGTELNKDVDDSPYRSDLASVVRPRRPSAGEGERSQRPTEGRPAPLKLVAEQRIDTGRDPIRPRRVSASELPAAQTDDGAANAGSFSDYAQQVGATQLPDLLEAAAAYISDVEGREQFSRPMLMHKLREVKQESFAREDGLRSFGQLLREGKIQKIKAGRFAVTEETEFRDEARHAG